MVRLVIGDSAEAIGKINSETITVLEANLDDLNPQVFGYVMDRLWTREHSTFSELPCR